MALKKAYEAPMLEIEEYCLDTSIAANCTDKLPYADKACYDERFEGVEFSVYADAGTTFDDSSTCDCYHTAGGEGFFTS